MLMPETGVDAALPALSVAVPEAVWFAPSPVMMMSLGQDFTPERASEQVKWIVTEPLYQPFLFADGEVDAAIVGAPVSRLMPAAGWNGPLTSDGAWALSLEPQQRRSAVSV